MQHLDINEGNVNKYVDLFYSYRKYLTNNYLKGLCRQHVQSFTSFYDDDIVSKLNSDYKAVGEDLERVIAEYERSIAKLTK